MSEPMTYARYLALDELLVAQKPLSDRHDELLFIVIHQTKELWLKEIIHEVGLAKRLIEAGDVEPAYKALARVSRLVLGAWDPKLGATGSVWDIVRDRRANHFVEVVSGVREAECSQLLLDFFAGHRG